MNDFGVKSRLIFALFFADGAFCLSRNFALQRVGNLRWLLDSYDLESLASSIDELVIVDASRFGRDIAVLVDLVQRISPHFLIPVTAGGGLRSLSDVDLLFRNGVDRVLLNSSIVEDSVFVRQLVKKYGSQALVGSIDFRQNRSTQVWETFIANGVLPTGLSLEQHVMRLGDLGAGEIMLTSIDRDGTGVGGESLALASVGSLVGSPFIVAGGYDTPDLLLQGFLASGASGVVATHLLNFAGEGLRIARRRIMENGVNLARWD